MILDLNTLRELPARLVIKEDASQLKLLADGVTTIGEARVELNIMQGDHIFFCTGMAVCDVDIECVRCLEQYRTTLEGEIDFSIHEVSDDRNVNLDELPENELIVPAGTTEVDITAPVCEALVLTLPLKPICKEECRGLCPICGLNRNKSQCECKVEETDSRWDGLRDLQK